MQTDTQTTTEILQKYTHWCSECTKAYDFTCSLAEATHCNEQKNKFLQDALKDLNK